MNKYIIVSSFLTTVIITVIGSYLNDKTKEDVWRRLLITAAFTSVINLIFM